MLAAEAHVAFVSAEDDLLAFLDDFAADDAGVAGGLAAAPANGFDFFDGEKTYQKNKRFRI